jgi:hypothetical protein
MRPPITFAVKFPDPAKAFRREKEAYARDLRHAQIYASDRASREGQKALRDKMSAVRLGRLGNAIGQTSTLRKGDKGGKPYGVLFARGGDKSRAGGALESYSRGARIEPNDAEWLWIAQPPVPKKIGRKRTTPALFMQSGLMGSIGKLEFRPLGVVKGEERALLIIKKVSVSPKTGRAKAMGPRGTRTRIPVNEVVAFVGIRITIRAKRFDKDVTLMPVARGMPKWAAEELARRRAARAG